MNIGQTTIIFVRHLAPKPRAGDIPDETRHVAGNAKQQLSALIKSLRKYPVSRVYSSDVIRAVETAEAIAQELGVPQELRPTLREVSPSHSIRPQSTVGAGSATQPAVVNRHTSTDEKQVSDTIDQIADQNHASCAVLVTHSGTIRTAIRHLLGLPLGTYDIDPLAYGGFAVLSREGRGAWTATAS